ncbi:MAG: histidine kinase [Pseudomonadota bacterium]
MRDPAGSLMQLEGFEKVMAQPPEPSPKRIPLALFLVVQFAIWLTYGTLLTSQTIEFRVGNDLPPDLVGSATKAATPVVVALTVTSVFHFIIQAQKTFDARRIFILSLIFTIVAAMVMAFLQYVAKWLLGYISDWQAALTHWLPYVPSRFFLLGLWVSAYLSIAFARDSLYHREQSLILQAAADEARADMLRYQLNPHLLFNALNTVSSHILDRDFERADHAVQKLADLMRLSLENNEARTLTLGQEIDRLEVYLDLERVRFGDGLTINIDLDNGLEDYPVPPMLLQPLIENAMKHGIARSAEGGVVSIHACQKEDKVIIEIANTNHGYIPYKVDTQKDPSFGVGLRNVSRRLDTVYGAAAFLRTDESSTPNSYSVEVHLPAEKT